MVNVTRDGGKLYAQASNRPRFRLWAESPSYFYLRVVPTKVSFERDSTGVPVLVLNQNGATQRARKQ